MTQRPAATTSVVTLADVRDLAVLPVWHASRPSVATVLGISRALAYVMAQRGELPTIRLGSRVVVPVPALLAMLGETPHLIGAQGETAGQDRCSHNAPPTPLTGRAS